MDLEEGMLRKIGISVAVVGLFIVLIVFIGTSYGSDGLGSAGGLALVGSIALFILVMAGVGLLLVR